VPHHVGSQGEGRASVNQEADRSVGGSETLLGFSEKANAGRIKNLD
jgi:hypothetical protein